MAQQLSAERDAALHAGGQLGRHQGRAGPVEHLLPESRRRRRNCRGGRSIPASGRRQQVFSALTGLFGTGQTTPATYAATRGKKVSDLVKAISRP